MLKSPAQTPPHPCFHSFHHPAFSLVNEGIEQEVETEVIASLREEDNQLYEAFTLLKGINVYRDLKDKAGSTVSIETSQTQEMEAGVSTN